MQVLSGLAGGDRRHRAPQPVAASSAVFDAAGMMAGSAASGRTSIWRNRSST